MTKQITISTEVYAAIWRNHHPGEEDEDSILRRLLIAKGKVEADSVGAKSKWIDDVVEGFRRIGGAGHYHEIYISVIAVRKENGHRIPPSAEAIIRREIENHSSDSQAYKQEQDLFLAPKGLGAGYWKLR